MAAQPVAPGSRPIPIDDFSAPLASVPDWEYFARTPGEHWVSTADEYFLLISHEPVDLADNEVLFASINGLTDRSRLEAGTLQPVDTTNGPMLVAAIHVPAGWRGSYDLLRLTVPVPSDQRVWWKTALARPLVSKELHTPDLAGHAFTKHPPYEFETIEADGRRITIARHTGAPSTTLPGMVVFDGPIFMRTQLLGFLGAHALPWVAFIDHGAVQERNKDLLFNPTFFEEIGAVLPSGPAILAGSSFGGLAALWGHREHPEKYPYAIGLSAPWVRMTLPEAIADPQVYLGSGTLEWLMKPSTELMTKTLEAGKQHMHNFVGGHDKYCWTQAIVSGLDYFFAP
ncbi:MAG: alpha/beta hydrolase-fold protein [Corynebacterium sp.]|nr:alpha/beta hydrolase-fold protein [Corynebacterium sp.]